MSRADPVALKKEGNTHFGKGRYAEAVESYTAAIDLWMGEADRAVLYSNRSAARLKIAGEKQKALSDAERAVQLAPTYAKGHFRRGQALRALGQPESAIEAMEKVLELEPGDGAAMQGLQELRAAVTEPEASGAAAKKTAAMSGGNHQLAGAFQPGRIVRPATKAVPAPFAPPKGPINTVVETGAQHQASENGLIIGEDDFHRVSSASSAFFERETAERAKHAALQPPKPPPTRAEQEFPGIVFPPGFGPDAEGWDPTYEPIYDLRGQL